MKKIYLFVFCLVISTGSTAAEFVGKIQSIAVGPNLGNLVLVRVEGHSPSAEWSAQCSNNGFWSFKFDSSGLGGKETYSLLLTAYASKAPIVIAGTGGCSAGDSSNNVQNINYARLAF